MTVGRNAPRLARGQEGAYTGSCHWGKTGAHWRVRCDGRGWNIGTVLGVQTERMGGLPTVIGS